MHDTPFTLDRQTYAKLSQEELQSLGKQAAVAYFSGCPSLNDAIIKIARQHPSISSHQVKRIAEFANQETFARMFSDNDKLANDKNIDFTVADPGAILQELNMQAMPDVVTLPDSDYHCGPVKTASAVGEVEADIELAREFGFDPISPGSESTVITKMATVMVDGQFTHRILGTVKLSTPADRILAAGEEGVTGDTSSALSQDSVCDGVEETSAEEELNKQAFLEGVKGFFKNLGVNPKSHELDSAFTLYEKDTGKSRNSMSHGNIADYVLKVRGQTKTAMGGPESMMMNAQPQQHPEVTHRENMRAMERRVEIEKKKQELMAMQSKAMSAPGDMGGAPEPGAQQGAPPQGGPPQGQPSPQGAPAAESAPQMQQPPPIQKMSSVMDEALKYAQMGRPMTAAVVNDLNQAVSIDRIKEAAAARGQYPMANPFGELHRMHEKLARVREEAIVARDKNEFMMKEAEDLFLYNVKQHVLGGGNLGELTHAVSSVPANDNVISSLMTKAAQHLVDKGVDGAKLRAGMIPYEMEKTASTRAPNLNHPVVGAFSSYCELAESHRVLNHAVSGLNEKYAEVDGVLTQAIRSQRARTA